MKRNLLFTLITLVGFAFGANAQETATIKKLADNTAPVVDGVIDEAWDEVDRLEITVVPQGQANNGYSKSASGYWRGLWNADGLYILIEMDDDVYGNDAPGSITYEDDGFDIAFAWGDLEAGAMKNNKDDDKGGFMELKIEANGNSLFYVKNYGFYRENQSAYDSTGYAANSKIETTTNFHVDIEAFMPWSVFNTESVADGDEFCFDLRYNDDDQTEGNAAKWTDGLGRDGQVMWGTKVDGGWNVPADWSRITLGEGNVIATGLFDKVAPSFNVYPNPATNRVNVTNVEAGSKVSVLNMIGQEVVSTVANAKNVSLDVASLKSGIYFVKVGASSQKLIVR